MFDIAAWKREEIPDRKFEHIDVDDFLDNSLYCKLTYMGVFLLTLKSILVYVADLGAVILVFSTAGFSSIISGTVTTTEQESVIFQPNQSIMNIGTPVKIIVVSLSVLASFILLAIELRKAKRIIRSSDISYSFTSISAYRYYAIKSYPHYCLCNYLINNYIVTQIQNSRKKLDMMAFFVYFRFKGWKRLIFAEAPRQVINFTYLYDITSVVLKKFTLERREPSVGGIVKEIYNGLGNTRPDQLSAATYVILCCTFLFYLYNVFALVFATFMYIPLVCQIRGNLKEYCVHKIDKR